MTHPHKLTRRDFIKLLSIGIAAGGSAYLEACARQNSTLPPPVVPTIKPTSTATRQPSASPSQTSTNVEATNTPDTRSHLIRARHEQVWQGDSLNPNALKSMLNNSVAQFTGLDDARQVWGSLFKPQERVAIKVNSIINGSTHVALAMAVVECLQDAGVPSAQITLYDRSSNELRQAGFPVSSQGNDLRCEGTDGRFVEGWKVGGVSARLSQVLVDCDALINIPILKAFSIGGLSFAMKNHYGSVDSPGRFHGTNFTGGVTSLNALEPISRRTRLIIGDVLTQETHRDLVNYLVVGGPKAILVGNDPVAMDAVGLQMAKTALALLGLNLGAVKSPAEEWLRTGADLGLGKCDLAQIKVDEVILTE